MGSFLLILVAVSLVGAVVGQRAPRCNGPNEELQCVQECPPARTCRTRDLQYRCENDDRKCKWECRCKEGYFLDFLRRCVSRKVCERCPGENEFFDCGTECDNECKNIATQNRTNCPIVNVQCNNKCYCEDGFARNRRHICIPVDQCRSSGN